MALFVLLFAFFENDVTAVRFFNVFPFHVLQVSKKRQKSPGGGGGGGRILPYKDLMGTCGQPGYVFRDFCLKQGIEFIIFCLNQGIDLSIFVLNWISFLGR